MDALRRDGLIVKIEKSEQGEPAIIDVTPFDLRGQTRTLGAQLRSYTFKDGSSCIIVQNRAFLDPGVPDPTLQIMFDLIKSDHYDEHLVDIIFTPRQSRINNAKPSKLHFDQYSSDIKPMGDQKLLDSIVTAINKFVTYSVVESEFQKRE